MGLAGGAPHGPLGGDIPGGDIPGGPMPGIGGQGELDDAGNGELVGGGGARAPPGLSVGLMFTGAMGSSGAAVVGAYVPPKPPYPGGEDGAAGGPNGENELVAAGIAGVCCVGA